MKIKERKRQISLFKGLSLSSSTSSKRKNRLNSIRIQIHKAKPTLSLKKKYKQLLGRFLKIKRH